jgi:hypothetical protein
MASASLKPGVPVILRELEPSSEMFKQGASLRVTGMYVLEPPSTCGQTYFSAVLNLLLFFSLQSYDVDSATAVIQDGSVSLKIDTQNLRDISFRTNSAYQFIGELLIRAHNDVQLSFLFEP